MFKKYIVFLISLSSFYFVSASSTLSPCLNLNTGLSIGSKSSQALSLQNFLYSKGFLKVSPNGYFGSLTFSAVKSYQKSVGLEQVGSVGKATRSAIKKDSCAVDLSSQSQNTNVVAVKTSEKTTQIQVISPVPTLDSIDLITLFATGLTDWTFNLHGSNFSSTTNTVYFKNVSNSRVYNIGSFNSGDSISITLPKNITNTVFSCGLSCNEKLSPGLYEVRVVNSGGQTAYKNIDIKSFTSSVINESANHAVPANATSTKIGTLNFASSEAVTLRNVTFNTVSSNISSNGFTNILLKDESTGSPLINNGDGITLSPFQSMIIGVYVTTNNSIPGNTTSNFTIEVEDYIGKNRTKFMSPSFLTTVEGGV